MAQPPSFSSNNPFRRKAPAPAVAAPPANIPPFDEADALSPTPETAPALPSADRFRNQLHALSTSNQPPPATSFQKPKVVKKVRVQSPPPSSPESPRAAARFPPVSPDDEESSSSDDTEEAADPFSYASSTGSADVSDKGDDSQPVPLHRPPPNPFQKTLRDLESGGLEPEQTSAAAAAAARGALDVGAFGRLLLTGQTGSPGLSQPAALYSHNTKYPPQPGGDGASTADTSSTSRHSISDTFQMVQETPRTSGEISAHEADDERRGLVSSPPALQPAPSIVKKPPPPPSSRHGKLIKPSAGGETNGPEGRAKPPLSSPTPRAATTSLASPSRQSPPTPSDVNKPLPAAPRRSPQEQDTESVFDREAAGKVPELELQPGLNIITPPSPHTTLHASATFPVAAPQATKKPAPPPRRQPHGRSESKIQSSAASIVQQEDTDASLRRSSIDSTRSRSSSLRANVHAPAPPPPRRPSHPPRGSSSHSVPPPNAPSADTAFERTASLPPIVASPPPISDSSRSSTPGTSTPFPPHPPPTTTAPTKLAPPPPPPARNASVRGKKRPVSGAPDVASLARKSSTTASAGRGKEQPPPPPRPRNRGNSGASIDAPVPVPMPVPSAPAVVGQSGAGAVGALEPVEDLAGLETSASASAAGDILADLSALQREVDALRGVYQQARAE